MSHHCTRYEIRDVDNRLVAVHVRKESSSGKAFHWESPGNVLGLNGQPVAELPLYGSHDLDKWVRRQPIVLVEGEKARDALAARGVQVLATVTGAHGCPAREVLESLRDWDVVLWPDADAVGRSHMLRIARQLQSIAKSVRVFDWPEAIEHGDAADYLAIQGWDSLELALGSAQSVDDWVGATGSVDAGSPLTRLTRDSSRSERVAAVRASADIVRDAPELEWTAARYEAEQRLRELCPAQEAISLAASAFKRTRTATEQGQGTSLGLEDVEPWANAVSGLELLDQLCATIRRFVVLPSPGVDAIALWVLMTWLMAHVPYAVRLIVTSPTRACGKTHLLAVVGAMVKRPLPASSISPAALFRCIEASSPTLLLDEMDNARLNDNAELRALLNSGHSRGGAYAIRTVGEEHEPRKFSTWCAIAFAAIGSLPDTVGSRGITIRLHRKPHGAKLERLREERLLAELGSLRRMMARWASDSGPAVAAIDPELPDWLDGRAADNWGVLFALADAAGGSWPARAREAARALEAGRRDVVDPAELLLEDVRQVFDRRGTDRLPSEILVQELVSMSERPWSEWKQGRQLTQRQLAGLLARFEIESRSIRLPDGRTPKGYLREQFQPHWESYLGNAPFPAPPHRHATLLAGWEVIGDAPQNPAHEVVDPMPLSDCGAVADSGRGVREHLHDDGRAHGACPRCGSRVLLWGFGSVCTGCHAQLGHEPWRAS